jgi:hypothetical protein
MKTVKNMAYIQIREITASEVVPLTYRLRFDVWSDETQLTARPACAALGGFRW